MKSRYMTEETKQYILYLYHEGYMSVDIAEQVGYNVSSICRYIKKQGLPIQNRIGCSTKIKQEICKKYLEGKTIRELHLDYPNFSEGWINGMLRREKITRRNGVAPKLNCHYFQNIDTEFKAYFLGLLFADGHIDHTHTKRNYRICLSLNTEDGYLIEKFAKEVQTSLKVKYYTQTKKDGRVRHTAILSLGSKEMYEDLLKLGMTEIKVDNLIHLPPLEGEMMRHFIRGYFDGDGSVYLSHVKKTGEIILGSNFTGNYYFLKELNDVLSKFITTKGRKPFDRGNYASLHFSSSKLSTELYNYLYKDNDQIFMKRKKEKFIEFFEFKARKDVML